MNTDIITLRLEHCGNRYYGCVCGDGTGKTDTLYAGKDPDGEGVVVCDRCLIAGNLDEYMAQEAERLIASIPETVRKIESRAAWMRSLIGRIKLLSKAAAIQPAKNLCATDLGKCRA
jgi:hypothetical protein